MDDVLFSGPGFSVRPAGREQMAELLQVYRECEDFLALGPRPSASLEMIEGDLALSASLAGRFCGIYDADGEGLLGVLDFAQAGHAGQAGVAFLELLMLVRSERGRGLGADVVSALHDHLRQTGARSIRAGVQVNNPAAQRFWRRMDYYVTGGPELMDDGTTVYHLRHDLRHA